MWNINILGYDVYHIFYFFFIYSFLGWVWEVFFVFLRTDRLVNRGFVNGPICPIYGVGATIIFLFLTPIEGNIYLLFIGGAIVATIVEYISAAIMENIFHETWWDYSDKKYNVKGRICLSVSIGWGFFSVVLMQVFHPAVYEIIEKIPPSIGAVLGYIIIIAFLSDFIHTFYYIKKFNTKLERISISREELRTKLESTKIYEAKEEILLKLELSDNEYIEEFREKYTKLKEDNEESKERIEKFIEDIKEHRQNYNSLIKNRTYVEKRIIKAFPKLTSLKNNEMLKEITEKINKTIGGNEK